jgi:DNA-directed RNA polymerase subunit RPC12/RpoP
MSKREPGRLYCKECSQAHETNRFKSIKCVDCGEEFFVDTRNMNKYRCDNCQHEENKKAKREWWQRNKGSR